MPSSSKTTVQGTVGELTERKARPGVKESDCILSRYDKERDSSRIKDSGLKKDRARRDLVGARQMRVLKIQIGRPQRLAALLLLFFLAECLWVAHHQELSEHDYRYARCGREMWERPSPLAGYFTTCGNLGGDGTFAYRVAGLPLTAQRLALLGVDKLRSPENRLYASGSLNGSTWEARHEIGSVKYLMHLPFIFLARWLGVGLWWVTRRLFGNEG